MDQILRILRAVFNQSTGALKIQMIAGTGSVYPTTPATLTTAGAATLTTAQVLGGILLRDPNGAGRTDTLPTAAQLVAATAGAKVGDTMEFIVRNTADAAETITIAAGTGGTVSGTATIAQNNTKIFKIRLDNVTSASEAYTIYSIGTFVH